MLPVLVTITGLDTLVTFNRCIPDKIRFWFFADNQLTLQNDSKLLATWVPKTMKSLCSQDENNGVHSDYKKGKSYLLTIDIMPFDLKSYYFSLTDKELRTDSFSVLFAPFLIDYSDKSPRGVFINRT